MSDFYAAYDGIRCPQQKCLIHLIRDLLIFPKYMTTICTLMRYISIGLIEDDWHGEEAVGQLHLSIQDWYSDGRSR